MFLIGSLPNSAPSNLLAKSPPTIPTTPPSVLLLVLLLLLLLLLAVAGAASVALVPVRRVRLCASGLLSCATSGAGADVAVVGMLLLLLLPLPSEALLMLPLLTLLTDCLALDFFLLALMSTAVLTCVAVTTIR
jgi:hypothetical protein